MKAFKSFFAIIMLLAMTTSPIGADTLILKTGDRVTGNFEGGTAHVVKFRNSVGDVKEYDVLNVLQILFSDERKTAVLPTASADSEDAVRTIPAGTKITIRMIDSIGSEDQTAGSLFLASLEAPLMLGGVEVIPKGADVWGRVTGSDSLGLELTEIFFNGNSYSISTGAVGKGKTLSIPTETKLEFTLKEPLVIAVRGEL